MNIIDTDSFQSEMTPVIICSGPHLDIEEWLKRLDLERYKGRKYHYNRYQKRVNYLNLKKLFHRKICQILWR